MKNNDKSRKQLIEEIDQLRVKISELEKSATGCLSDARLPDRQEQAGKQAERELEIQKIYMEELFEGAPEAITILDNEDRVQKINREFTNLFGYSSSEAIGCKINDLIVPSFLKAEGLKTTAAVAAGERVSIETIRQNKDGQRIYVSILGHPIKIKEGQLAVYGIYRDITERKQAEEELKESEEKYRLMVESSGDAIVISQNDIFIFFNEAFAKMLGYDMRELEALNYKDIYTEKAVEYLKEHTRQLTNGEDVPDRYETLFKRKDGSEIDVEANITIIDYKGQKATFAVIRDITKQKEIFKTLQKSAEQSNGLKEFISICAGCNKIRDDEQENRPWVSPADYISDRLPDIKFSHGMCPDCMKKWYPDYMNGKSSKDSSSEERSDAGLEAM